MSIKQASGISNSVSEGVTLYSGLQFEDSFAEMWDNRCPSRDSGFRRGPLAPPAGRPAAVRPVEQAKATVSLLRLVLELLSL